MALWLVRAGRHGEFESKFLNENRIYLTWNGLNIDLSGINDQDELRELLQKIYADSSIARIRNHLSQIWAFSKRIKKGDWVVLPSKHKPAIHVAKVTGDYVFDQQAQEPFFHHRSVDWVALDIPRSNFDQDLLYSFGAFLTICQITRNDAEQRIAAMAKNDWKASPPHLTISTGEDDSDDSNEIEDISQIARDQIGKLISARFKGHGMAHLVDAVLRAQGYTTYVSPQGPDKGIDILAGSGPMGFDEPRICVQVKSGDTPLDRPTLDQLIGVMQTVQASHGLLVSWGGFKSSIDREEATQFFRVRLWDQGDLIEQVLAQYERLGDDIRAELPLKRIWVVADAGD